MSNDNETRLNSAQLDADISVLGDDRSGEPKGSRFGSAPEPQAKEGLRQAVKPDAAEPGTRDDERTRDEIGQQKAEKESIRDVVDGYGKG